MIQGVFTGLRVLFWAVDGCSDYQGRPLQEQLRMNSDMGGIFMFAYILLFLFVTIGIFNLIMAVFIDNVTDGSTKKRQRQLGQNAPKTEYVIANTLRHIILVNLLKREAEEELKEDERNGGNDGRRISNTLNEKLLALQEMYGYKPHTTEEYNELTDKIRDEMAERDIVVTKDQFNHWLTTEKEFIGRLDDSEIDLSCKFDLFDVLDADLSGELEFEEMVDGLLKCRGPASKTDIIAIRLKTALLAKAARDLGVLAVAILRARRGYASVLELFAGSGLRAARYLAEGSCDFIWANEANQDVHQAVVARALLGYCRATHRQFDVVDVDAFGCWTHIGDALEAVRPGGLLYLTATGLTSWKPSRSFRALGCLGRCPPAETIHDQMCRALVWHVAQTADRLNLVAETMFTLYRASGDVYRIGLLALRLVSTAEVEFSNVTHVEAKLPPLRSMSSWLDTAKKIADIKEKVNNEFTTVIDGHVVHHVGKGRKAEIAQCVFSALLAGHQLASAGMAITAGVQTCGFGGVERKIEACTANIGGAMATIAGAASFLSELAITCPSGDNWRAGCANPILTLLSGLGGLAAHAAGASQSCANIENGATIFNPVSVNDETGLTNCILNANQGAFFVGRAGIQVDALANGACDRFTKDAETWMAERAFSACSAAVTGTLTSFSAAASFLAGAVSKCTKFLIFTPACTANIAGLVADLLKVANFASSMVSDACHSSYEAGRKGTHMGTSATNRRLEDGLTDLTNMTNLVELSKNLTELNQNLLALPQLLSDAGWEVEVTRPQASLSHCHCPWGGKLIRVTVSGIAVEDPPVNKSYVMVRPETCAIFEGGLLEHQAPGEAVVRRSEPWGMLRHCSILFSMYFNDGIGGIPVVTHQKMRRDYPAPGDSAYAFFNEGNDDTQAGELRQLDQASYIVLTIQSCKRGLPLYPVNGRDVEHTVTIAAGERLGLDRWIRFSPARVGSSHPDQQLTAGARQSQMACARESPSTGIGTPASGCRHGIRQHVMDWSQLPSPYETPENYNLTNLETNVTEDGNPNLDSVMLSSASASLTWPQLSTDFQQLLVSYMELPDGPEQALGRPPGFLPDPGLLHTECHLPGAALSRPSALALCRPFSSSHNFIREITNYTDVQLALSRPSAKCKLRKPIAGGGYLGA
eukprot:g22627.t1